MKRVEKGTVSMPVTFENCSKQNTIPQSAAELATQPNFPLPRVKCTRHHRMGLFPCGGVRHTRSPRNPRAQFKNKTNFPTSLLCGIRYFHFLKKEREREKSRWPIQNSLTQIRVSQGLIRLLFFCSKIWSTWWVFFFFTS